MKAPARPYGMDDSGAARCVNAEPGTFDHECGKPATWIGTKRSGFQACFCEQCKVTGWDAAGVTQWRRM